jgi:TonB family protein
MLTFLVNHLWQSTLFAVAAALLIPLVRNNGAHVRYWVWWAASVKFLVPFSLLTTLGDLLAGSAAPIYVVSDFTAAVERLAAPMTTSPFSTELMLALLGAWAIGSVAVLGQWLTRTLRLRSVLRSAVPYDDPLLEGYGPVVKCSDVLLEPSMVGVLRPVLLLPRGIAERLTRTQLGAIVAHELCHWHRRDNLTAAVHMLVEAVFWFHPLVWWIGARLVDERERACDEGVVRGGHDPRAYADGILNVCEFYVATSLPCAAGVSGADLKQRVTNIMRNRAMKELNIAKKTLFGAAALGALLVPVVVGVVTGRPAFAQDDADVLPLVRIAPDYPAEAVRQGLEGRVILEFTITAEGTTKDISVVESSSPLFEQPAIAALDRWRYMPQTVDGEAVERTGIHTMIRFVLDRDEPAPTPTPGQPVVVRPDPQAQ